MEHLSFSVKDIFNRRIVNLWKHSITMEKRKARNIYSKVQSFCHNSHPFDDETRLNEGIRNTTNETYVSLFCHNIEAACNLPRGVAAKRSNQQNDSFGQCTLPFFFLPFPLQPPFLFPFFIAAWLCCFHCAHGSLSAVRRGDTLQSYVTSTRLPLTSIPDWVSSFALPTVIGEQKRLVSRITTQENPIFAWCTCRPFYASWIQFRAFPRRIETSDP